MTTHEIIEVYMIQGNHLDVTEKHWKRVMKIKLNRSHLEQVLLDLKHCDGICKDVQGWLKLNSWSDLVAMVDCALDLKTNSYLNTIY